MDIKTALSRLDPENEAHWTSDGLPRVEAVSELVGQPVTRKEITTAWPEFNLTMLEELLRESTDPEKHGGVNATDSTDSGSVILGEDGEPLAEDEADLVDKVEAGEESESDVDFTPEMCAYVAQVDEVVGMAPGVVLSDIGLVDRAILELNRQGLILSARKEAIEKALLRISKLTERCERAKILLKRRGLGGPKESPIQEYLQRTRELREKRAKEIERYLQSGLAPDHIRAAQAQQASAIDAAMKQRKPSKQHQRPQRPPMMGE